MASPGNQQCANCIDTLSFPMCSFICENVTYNIRVNFTINRHDKRRKIFHFLNWRCRLTQIDL